MGEPSCARAAAWYARRKGFWVLPLHWVQRGRCSCSAPACRSPAKHPLLPHGLKDASRDEQLIALWWRRWPLANVGIATGARSGLVVLDVDPHKDGEATLQALEARHGALPSTVQALTGGGGQHLLFAHPGEPVRNSAGLLGPGLDVRGDGGYIVAPPSVHARGRRYHWEVSSRPEEVELSPLPPWLAQALRPQPQAVLSLGRAEEGWLRILREGVPEGQRNATCAALAGYLLRIRLLRPAIAGELVHLWNQARCQPPLSYEEVQRTLDSVARLELCRRQKEERRCG